MARAKQERLEAKGWTIGTVSEFLELTPEENALIEIELALGRNLKARRKQVMTQVELAQNICSSFCFHRAINPGNASNRGNPSRYWKSDRRSRLNRGIKRIL